MPAGGGRHLLLPVRTWAASGEPGRDKPDWATLKALLTRKGISSPLFAVRLSLTKGEECSWSKPCKHIVLLEVKGISLVITIIGIEDLMASTTPGDHVCGPLPLGPSQTPGRPLVRA